MSTFNTDRSDAPSEPAGQNAEVPRVLRPTPRAPEDVITATRVFSSEALAALVAHYRRSPGSQRSAANALSLPTQRVAENVRVLVAAGVLLEEVDPADRRARIYRVDAKRLAELITALRRYTLGRS